MKRMLRWLFGTSVVAAAILAAAGTADPWLWAYLLTFAAVGAWAMYSVDEDLARERFHPPEPGADRLSLRMVRLIALAHVVVAVADHRMGWTHVPPPLRGAGLVLFALSFLLIVHSMRTNRFFSAVVRIQGERGHRVVDAGPYAVVRHPGYAAMAIGVPMSGLAFGSWYGFATALIYSALIVRRALFEDGFLCANLPGYAAYTQRVRHRLIPGIF